jgi:hypothetical protein
VNRNNDDVQSFPLLGSIQNSVGMGFLGNQSAFAIVSAPLGCQIDDDRTMRFCERSIVESEALKPTAQDALASSSPRPNTRSSTASVLPVANHASAASTLTELKTATQVGGRASTGSA